LFLRQPDFLDLGSGYMITASTILLIFLIPFSLFKKIKKINSIDVIVLLFLLWCVFNLLVFQHLNVFFGVLRLTETLLAYFILRTYLTTKSLPWVTKIFVSMLIFQSIISLFQSLVSRPLGLLFESSLYYYPLGIKNEDIFRVTGTFGHANMFALVLIALMPFLFIEINLVNFLVIIAGFVVLLLTYSRAAWLVGLLFIAYLIISSFFLTNKVYLKKRVHILFFLMFFLIFLVPNVFPRVSSIPETFEENGSMGTRIKLIQESINMIKQYPLTGIGINRFQDLSSEEAVTDVYRRNRFTSGTLVHNVFSELGVEIGLPGLALFCSFLTGVYFFYIQEIKKGKNILNHNIGTMISIKKAALTGMTGLIFMASFNPFFQTAQFKLLFLMVSLILV